MKDYEEELIRAEDFNVELEIQLRKLREHRNQSQPSRTSEILTDDQPSSETAQRWQPLHTRAVTEVGISEEIVSYVSFPSINAWQFHKLPEASLPTFNGDILSCLGFF